ncbi:hypothetical protein HYQ46_005184 [Verticillium longisporum]|nr:hypothetical protein HYQ46_005184 [Verticillium longisporum]
MPSSTSASSAAVVPLEDAGRDDVEDAPVPPPMLLLVLRFLSASLSSTYSLKFSLTVPSTIFSSRPPLRPLDDNS